MSIMPTTKIRSVYNYSNVYSFFQGRTCTTYIVRLTCVNLVPSHKNSIWPSNYILHDFKFSHGTWKLGMINKQQTMHYIPDKFDSVVSFEIWFFLFYLGNNSNNKNNNTTTYHHHQQFSTDRSRETRSAEAKVPLGCRARRN